MTDLHEIEEAISLLMDYPNCIAWQDFSDKGNTCCGKYQDGSIEAKNLGTVKLLIPKYSSIHVNLNESVSNLIGANWVTYDWLIKVVSRIVSVSSLSNFKQMLGLSILVKDGMKKRGLTEIQYIEEAFA